MAHSFLRNNAEAEHFLRWRRPSLQTSPEIVVSCQTQTRANYLESDIQRAVVGCTQAQGASHPIGTHWAST
jgi:hypothetical protein